MASCCPDKPYKARGLCTNCYARRPESLEHRRKYLRWRKYKLTQERYEELLRMQDGHCALCSETQGLEVDHDHETKVVRGLLCDRHNRGLGFFSHTELQQALEYVNRSHT